MNPNTREKTEAWMASLGTKFCKVYYFARGEWHSENHVEDHETFLETVSQMCRRNGVRHAIWDVGDGQWAVLDIRTGDTRIMPSQDAAVMLVTHAR